MKQYEFITVHVDWSGNVVFEDGTGWPEKTLDDFGREGWSIVAAFTDTTEPILTSHMIIMQREIELRGMAPC